MSASFGVESVLLQGKSSTSSRPDGYSNEIMCNRHIFNIDRMAIKLRHNASVEIRLYSVHVQFKKLHILFGCTNRQLWRRDEILMK